MKCLLDTHVWIWYLLGSDQLNPKHRRAIEDDASELWLSPISVWETALLIERKKLPVAESSESWIERAFSQLTVREATLTFDIAIKARQLSGLHEDPADRFIVATAAALGLTLLTSDARLLHGSGYAAA